MRYVYQRCNEARKGLIWFYVIPISDGKIVVASWDFFFFFWLGFTPHKAEQPLRGMKLQEKEAQKDESIQEICLERTYS